MNSTTNKSPTTLKLNLALGAFALFFLSFLMSGNASAIPQLFFERVYPATKTYLLSVSLFWATVAAVLGVLISRRTKPRSSSAAIGLLITVVLALGLFSSATFIFFLCCLIVVQFADNFLLNQIDLASVARSESLRQFNDTAGITARLLGMLTAPVFFTAFSSRPLVEKVIVAVVGAASIAGCMRLFSEPASNTGIDEVVDQLNAPDRTDWLVFGYAICIYAALYLFAANLIYILRDLFHFQNSATLGGISVLTVFLMALVANSAVSAVQGRFARSSERTLRPAIFGACAVVLIFVAFIILSGVRTGLIAVLVGCGSVGLTYGMFLWEIRDYSSSAAKQGKTVLLSWFNNMSNISSLLAFGLMVTMAAQRAHSPELYYFRVISAIAALPALGLIVLTCAFVVSRRKLKPAEDSLKAAESLLPGVD